MKIEKPNFEKMKGIMKQKVDDAVAYCKLHRNTVIASAAAFAGGLASTIFITKKLSGKDQCEDTDEPLRWEDDPEFEEATIHDGNTPIHGAWFTTGKGGRIFFAEDEDGKLP